MSLFNFKNPRTNGPTVTPLADFSANPHLTMGNQAVETWFISMKEMNRLEHAKTGNIKKGQAKTSKKKSKASSSNQGRTRTVPLAKRTQMIGSAAHVRTRSGGKTKRVQRTEIVRGVRTNTGAGLETIEMVQLSNRISATAISESTGYESYIVLGAKAFYTPDSATTLKGSIAMAWDANPGDGAPVDTIAMSKYMGFKKDSLYNKFSVRYATTGTKLFTLNERSVESEKWTNEANLWIITSGSDDYDVFAGTISVEWDILLLRPEEHNTEDTVPRNITYFASSGPVTLDGTGNPTAVTFDAEVYNDLGVTQNVAGELLVPPGKYRVKCDLNFNNGTNASATTDTFDANFVYNGSAAGFNRQSVYNGPLGSNVATTLSTILNVGAGAFGVLAIISYFTQGTATTPVVQAGSTIALELLEGTPVHAFDGFIDAKAPTSVSVPMSTRDYETWRYMMWSRKLPVLPSHRKKWNFACKYTGKTPVDEKKLDPKGFPPKKTKMDEMRLLLMAMQGIKEGKSAIEIFPDPTGAHASSSVQEDSDDDDNYEVVGDDPKIMELKLQLAKLKKDAASA